MVYNIYSAALCKLMCDKYGISVIRPEGRAAAHEVCILLQEVCAGPGMPVSYANIYLPSKVVTVTCQTNTQLAFLHFSTVWIHKTLCMYLFITDASII